jgi:hypothetical protein
MTVVARRAHILFSNSELFTMRADGSRQTTVLPTFLDAHHPDWQPVPKHARAEDHDETITIAMQHRPGPPSSSRLARSHEST